MFSCWGFAKAISYCTWLKEIIKPSGPHYSEGFNVSTLQHCMMLCSSEASLSKWTWNSSCTASKFLKINFLFSICTSFSSSVVSVLKQLFIMKCCCLMKLKSAQNIFVNQWCAINEQVLLLKSLFGLWYSETCLIKEECTFVLNVTEVNLKTTCDLWNSLLGWFIQFLCFFGCCMFIY